MCAINFPSIKFVTLPLNNLFLFCWSSLGALAIESKDLFCDYKDAFDPILGWGGGGGGVFSFLEADEDGVGQGGIEGDLCLLEGDGKGWEGEWSLLRDGEWSSRDGEDT